MKSFQSAAQGFAPPPVTNVSEFVHGEMLGLSGGTARTKGGDAGIGLNTNISVSNRKIYCWLYVSPLYLAQTIGGIVYPEYLSYIVSGNIIFYLNQTVVGQLPVSTYARTNYPAGWTASTQISFPVSFPSTLANGSSTNDSVTLYVTNPQAIVQNPGQGLGNVTTDTQPNTVTIQPHYITGVFDSVRFLFDNVQGIFDMRMWLGVISSG